MIWLLLACTPEKEDSAVEMEKVSINGSVRDLFTQNPISAVDICLQSEVENCTQSTDDGDFILEGIPAVSNVSLSLQHEEYYGGLISFHSETQSLAPVDLGSQGIISSQFGLMGIEQQPNTGIIVFSISNGIAGDGINVEGVLVRINSGDGPFYTNTTGLPSTSITETSTHGGGVIVNLQPGEHEIIFENLPQDCSVLLGWGDVSAVQSLVMADHVSYVRLACLSEDVD